MVTQTDDCEMYLLFHGLIDHAKYVLLKLCLCV